MITLSFDDFHLSGSGNIPTDIDLSVIGANLIHEHVANGKQVCAFGTADFEVLDFAGFVFVVVSEETVHEDSAHVFPDGWDYL